MDQIRHLKVTLIVQQGHVLLEEGEIDQEIAFQLVALARELGQDVVGIEIAVLKPEGGVQRSDRAPG